MPVAAGGVTFGFSFRFTLVADGLALTTRRTRPANGGSFTNVITDGYSVAGDVLTVERQLSVVQQPSGMLVTLSDPRNNRQTIVYRRDAASAR
jgi:hypothetical protein